MTKKNTRGEYFFFICLIGIAISALLIALLLSIFLDVPFGNFTRDPSSIHPNSKFYFGFISNIGVLFWSFASSICYYSYSIIKNEVIDTQIKSFFLWAGTISLVLLFDDLFLMHEKFFPKVLFLNEKIVFALYGVLVLIFLIKHQKLILENTRYIYLVIALLAFGLSLVFDFMPRFSDKWHHIFEDGPKFIGIVFWFGYHALTSRLLLIAHFSSLKK